jgi:hypothetical protein
MYMERYRTIKDYLVSYNSYKENVYLEQVWKDKTRHYGP